MNMSFFEIIKLGQRYMKLWPNKAVLINYFAEYRAVQVSRFVCRYFPTIAIIIFIVQLYFGSFSILPQALMYVIFILSMPVQALVMLGVKADKFLPPALASWYKEGVARVNESGGDIKLSLQKPRYFDLANLLNLTYSKVV
ncbi:MAG: DUF412 domain-containing protein [Alteromonadaceae bacterium]|nr:DUF412 domain-containing protein [Alteromonadaceae bacterium]